MKLVLLALLSTGCALGTLPEGSAAPPNHVHQAVTSADVVSLPDIAERVVQGVVSVTTRRAGLTGEGSSYPIKGLGSGVVIDVDGTLVTNHHVIEEALDVWVTLADGTSHKAVVVGSDPRSDVAVLRMVDPPAGLQPLLWGDSEGLRLGETVLAVGNPYGMGHTLTRGIVSAKGRARVGIAEYEDFIQTDAAINPGNSGGALVDLDGGLVGIPTAIFSKTGGFSGISLAIPSKMAHIIVDDILEDGKVDRGWLGVVLRQTERGVVLIEVAAEGSAHQAGLLPGDVVLSFNGEPTRDMDAFRTQVAFAGAGKAFRTVVLRAGERTELAGVLNRRPDDPSN